MQENPIPLQHVAQPILYDSLPLKSRVRLAYHVTYLADGNSLSLPCLILVGRSHRPRLSCVALVHGNEPEGMIALYELWHELDVEKLDGTVVIVPVANPPAFRAGMRRNPEDQIDMNRICPGKPDGNTTEQLAYHLLHGIVAGSDLLLSTHGFTGDAVVVPYTEYPKGIQVTDASRMAARAFGLEYIEDYDWFYGDLANAATRMGIPGIEPEIGGLGITTPEGVALYKRGILNLLKHLGILPGKPEIPRQVRHINHTYLYAPTGGVIRRHLELRDQVHIGDRIMTITDLFGEPLAEIISPKEGFIGVQRLQASVNPGELVGVIFQLRDD